MSMDIRSFFQASPQNKSSKKPEPEKKKKMIIISDSESESEDDKKKRKSSSSSKSPKKTPKKSNSRESKNDTKDKLISKYFNGNLKPMKPVDVFGSAPVKRTPVQKPLKNSKQVIDLSKDDDFDELFLHINDKELNEMIKLEPGKSSPSKEEKITTPKKKNNEKYNKNNEKELVSMEDKYKLKLNTTLNDTIDVKKARGKNRLPDLSDSSESENETYSKEKVKSKFKSSTTETKVLPSPEYSKTSTQAKTIKTTSSPFKEKVKIGTRDTPSVTKQKITRLDLSESDDDDDDNVVIVEKTPSIEQRNQQSPQKRKAEPINEISPKKQNVITKIAGQKRKLDTESGLVNESKKVKTDRPSPSKIRSEKSDEVIREVINRPSPPVSNLWVDKYRPTTLKQLIGQQGDKSNVKKLINWLSKWKSNHSGNKKLQRPSPWAKDDDGAYFKAALLSGPPGIGKTTTAHLVCKELGFDVVEFNASDTRSKKLLHLEVSELLSSKSLAPFFTGGGEEVTRNHVLLMDEVDGMAGNEDRGGIQELIQLVKTARVPIICMCNDRNHPKMRSLVNYCYDLRFNRPRVEQIKGAMLTICYKENFKVLPDVLNDIIKSTNQDIRLVLNHLSVLAAQKDSKLPNSEKFVKLGAWDVVRKVFSEEELKTMSFNDKMDLFFHDYGIAPLFVQENYLNVVPHAKLNKIEKMEAFAKAAESISSGDLIDKVIRTRNAWSMLPVQAVFSSVVPGETLKGHMGGQISFPAWLGKNSTKNKMDRLQQELLVHTRLRVSGSKESINLDYSHHLRDLIVRPLVQSGSEGVANSLEALQSYDLLKEDLESLLELCKWPNSKDPMAKVESKVKAAFTRAYNKSSAMSPYAVSSVIKKGKGVGSVTEEEELYNGEEVDGEKLVADEEEEQGDQDNIEVDAMISVKKKTSKKQEKQEPSTSKQKGGGGKRGRGRGK